MNNAAPNEAIHAVPEQVIRDGLSDIGLTMGVYAIFGIGLTIVRAAAC